MTNPYEIEERLRYINDDVLSDEYLYRQEDYRIWGQTSKYNSYYTNFVLNRDTHVKRDYNNKPLYEFFEFHPRYKEDESVKVIPFIDPDTGAYQRVYPEKFKKLEEEYKNIKEREFSPDVIDMMNILMVNNNSKDEKDKGGEEAKENEKIDKRKIERFRDIYKSAIYLILNDKNKSPFDEALSFPISQFVKSNNDNNNYFPNIPSSSLRLPDFNRTVRSRLSSPTYKWTDSFPEIENKSRYFESWMSDEEYDIFKKRYIDDYNNKALKWSYDAPIGYIEKLHDSVNASQKYLKGEYDSYIWLRDLKAIDKNPSTHVERLSSNFRKIPAKKRYRYKERRGEEKFRRLKIFFRILFLPIKIFYRFTMDSVLKPLFLVRYRATVLALKRFSLRMITGMPLHLGFHEVVRYDLSPLTQAALRYQKKKLKLAQLPFLDIVHFPFVRKNKKYMRARRIDHNLRTKVERFKSSPKIASLFVLPLAITTSVFMTWKFIESRNTLSHHNKEVSLIKSKAMTLKGNAEDRKRLRSIMYDELFSNKKR